MMHKEIILIGVGLLLVLTPLNPLISIIIILMGVLLLYRKVKNPTKAYEKEIANKRNELNNISEKLTKMEKDKKEELNKLEKEKKDELTNLEKEKTEEIEKKLSDKQEQLDNINKVYSEKAHEKEVELDQKLINKKSQFKAASRELEKIEEELKEARYEIEFQECGLYEPKYKFINAVAYKEQLDEIRKKQKSMIKDKTAAVASNDWMVNGDKRQGKALNNANIKQILRSFNNETEVIINKVKHSNIDASRKRIQKSFDQLNRLYEREDVHLTNTYLNLKFDEMYLAYEYELKKEEEKEELREAREREREEKKLQKELDKEKEKFNKENSKINDEIEHVKQELTTAAAEEKAKLEAEIAKLQAALDKNNEEIKKINEYKEKPGAGYVYIISNIGSFGEGVYKIGVTRRDNPEDRIRELSSASVPFRFDTHVFIFSKNAYDLENELHERFDKQRVNKVNRRKEFFRITMDDVKQIVEENKGAVHSFVEYVDAEEYYDTLKIENNER